MKTLSQTTTHRVRSEIESAFNGGKTLLIPLFSPQVPLQMNPEQLKTKVLRYQDPQPHSEAQRPRAFGKESFMADIFRVQMREDFDYR